MYDYNSAWSDELKAAERRRYRAECKVRCLTAALDRTAPEGFETLMTQIEAAQAELENAAAQKFRCLWEWSSSVNAKGGNG